MKSELAEDISFVLFLLPLILTGGYVIWGSALSSGFNTDIYLSITRNPIIFAVSIGAVSAATLIEVYSNPSAVRETKLGINARRMQLLAGTTIFASVVAAWISSGSSATLPGVLGLFLSARFPLIFSVLLYVLSSVLSLQFKVPAIASNLIVSSTSVVVLLLAPIFFFAGTTAQMPVALVAIGSVSLLVLGIVLFAQANKTWFGTKDSL
jgi:hypothetical protein